jgi:2',5'-phosphodiesterase
VSQKWWGRLHTFFAQNGYFFVCRLYGHAFNGYMGVGIAAPLIKYDVEDVHAERVADHLKMPPPPPPPDLHKWLRKRRLLRYYKCMPLRNALALLVGFVTSVLLFLKLTKPTKEDPWGGILRRQNVAVAVQLYNKSAKRSFIASTYHMPCAFRDPDVMLVHSAVVLEYVQGLAKEKQVPYILAGDFNVKPHDSPYSMYLDGGIDEQCPDLPPPKGNWTWAPKLDPVRSAYRDCLGEEPEYTNNAWVKGQAHFVETLDYVWVSDEWNVHGVLDVAGPGSKEAVLASGQPFPAEEQPSDHVLLAANLSL